MKHRPNRLFAVLLAALVLWLSVALTVGAADAGLGGGAASSAPADTKTDAKAGTADGEEKAPVFSDLGVEDGSLGLPCRSAILMEATTGAVIYTQNAEESMPPASVTKVMTLLLLMEAIDAGVIHLDDTVTVSANAASMGGSQIFLKEGEQMKLEDLLKSVVIASANDAAVALAEYLCGSVQAFVGKMNERARALGMTGTSFENVTGLDDTAEHHVTSARDIAIMSRELVAHKTVLQYSSIWMDTIRDGAFGLTNTNRLVRFYPGCTGLKTGSTSKAGFCISVTAEREGFSLICVIMGAESRDVRNAAAVSLLDWGFANYGLYTAPGGTDETVPVTGGIKDTCALSYAAFSAVLPKSKLSSVEQKIMKPETLGAPIGKGDAIGSVTYVLEGETVGQVPLTAAEEVRKIGFFDILGRVMARFLLV